MKLAIVSRLLILLTCGFILSSASESDQDPIPKKKPQSVTSAEDKKSQTGDPTKEREQQDKSTTKTQAQAPQPSPTPDTTKDKYEKRQIEIQERIADYTWKLVWVGCIIGFFQILVMFLTYFVTGKAADAAKQSADIAKESLTISERAWVRVDFQQLYEPGMSFVDVEITNTGKTPGHIKKITIVGFDVSDPKQPITWKPDLTVNHEGATLWTIFPGQNTTQRYDQLTEFESGEIWKILQQTKRLTIYEFVVYDDIFGNRRTTRFHRVFMRTEPHGGRFMIPPDAGAGQNEAT